MVAWKIVDIIRFKKSFTGFQEEEHSQTYVPIRPNPKWDEGVGFFSTLMKSKSSRSLNNEGENHVTSLTGASPLDSGQCMACLSISFETPILFSNLDMQFLCFVSK